MYQIYFDWLTTKSDINIVHHFDIFLFGSNWTTPTCKWYGLWKAWILVVTPSPALHQELSGRWVLLSIWTLA